MSECGGGKIGRPDKQKIFHPFTSLGLGLRRIQGAIKRCLFTPLIETASVNTEHSKNRGVPHYHLIPLSAGEPKKQMTQESLNGMVDGVAGHYSVANMGYLRLKSRLKLILGHIQESPHLRIKIQEPFTLPVWSNATLSARGNNRPNLLEF